MKILAKSKSPFCTGNNRNKDCLCLTIFCGEPFSIEDYLLGLIDNLDEM